MMPIAKHCLFKHQRQRA